ncbi:MAG: hypothetical protein H6592_04545 [Flavobacteriales bacterium]|nr:hypothetical protein [Flavobacteriales bacterium]
MNTRTKAFALLLGACGAVNAQLWNTAGNTISGATQYLGCDALSTQQLRLKTVANLPIDFHTANVFRARINQKVTYGTLGSFSLIPADGFTLITPSDHFLGSNPKGPFSRSHLAEGEGDNAQPTGYRPWQRNGITFTGNGDQGYIGHKYNGEESDSNPSQAVHPSFCSGLPPDGGPYGMNNKVRRELRCPSRCRC